MKIKSLFFMLIVLGIAACKKDTTKVQQSILEFDLDGAHHAFNIDTVKLQVTDTGSAAGKSLYIFTGYGGLPQVRFTITDRSYEHSATCFPVGFYPNIVANAACHDTVPNSFCLGFLMQYTDTGVGHVSTLDIADSVSSLNVVSCSGTPTSLSATFNCVLMDPSGFTAPRTVTNGKLSNITYVK